MLYFVEKETAEERYESIARWLQLDPLVKVQSNLRALRQRSKAAAEDQSTFENVNRQLAKITANGVSAWDDTAVLAYGNRILIQLDKTLSLQSLDRSDSAFVIVHERAKKEEKGLEALRQIRLTAARLYEEKHDPVSGQTLTTGKLHEFAAAVRKQRDSEATEVIEREATANAAFAALWKVAEPLFAQGKAIPDECPICMTPIPLSTAGTQENIRTHLASHLARIATYAKAKRSLDSAQENVKEVRYQLLAALDALWPLLSDNDGGLKNSLTVYRRTLKSWVSGAVPDAATLRLSLIELLAKLDASISEIQSKQGDRSYTRVASKFEELFDLMDERDLGLRCRAEREKLSAELDSQATFISGEIRKRVYALLEELQGPINEIYRQVQGTNAAPIRLELPAQDDTNQQRLTVVIDFAKNRLGVQPSGYLSDSQIHSLALALRLAAIKRFNRSAPIILLDDIVTSYDADHRRSIASLLAKDFTECQLIITTHDELFFKYLKDQLGDSKWHFTKITRLDPDFGPSFVEHKVGDDIIERRWHDGESAANDMRQAEEEWLLGLALDFGVDLRIRPIERPYSYERSELAAALAKFLHELGLIPPLVPGVNNRFLLSLQTGTIENFGSHFQASPYGFGSRGDEQARWNEFTFFRAQLACRKCGGTRFKRPTGLKRPVCKKEGCELGIAFPLPPSPAS